MHHLVLPCHELTSVGGGSKVRRQQGQRGRRRISATARCRRKVAIEAGLCRSGRTGGAPGPVASGSLRYEEPGPPPQGGKAAALGHQEPVSRDAQGGVVVEAAPAPALEVPQPELLLQLLEVALDAPAQLRDRDQLLEGRRLGQGREPVLRRLLLALGPLGEEPLLGPRLAQPEVAVRPPDPPRREARAQPPGRGLAPADAPPPGRAPARRSRCAGRTRSAAKRELSSRAVPSRQVTLRHASAGRPAASLSAASG